MKRDINKMYREEGWGLITDEVLGIDPEHVESQARYIAMWAYEEIQELKSQIEVLENKDAN